MQTFTEVDWNFDKVPDKELLACCIWEYARESAFIEDVRMRSIQNWRAGGYRDENLSADLGRIYSSGPMVEVLTRGFYFAPGDPHRIDMQRNASVTNSFPAPWQVLADDERDFRVRVSQCAGWYPAKPFERADRYDAKEITEQAEAQWQKVSSEFHRVRQEYPEASEVDLTVQGKLQPYNGIPVSILREEGKEVTVVAINWARFTNEEIVSYFRKWVKASRPRDIRGPNNQGRKSISDRVKLERLAIMRLLHRCKVNELRSACPSAWKRYNTPNRRWRKDLEKAHAHFREFFPFLRENEFPRSWPPKERPDRTK